MHAADARHLYEDVAEPLLARAALVISRPVDGDAPAGEDGDPADAEPLRATFAETPARNVPRPRPSWTSWSPPATARWSPSTPAVRPSAPDTDSSGSTRRSSTPAGCRRPPG